MSSAKKANLATNLGIISGQTSPADYDEVDRALRSYGQYWAEGLKLPALGMDLLREHFVIGEGREHLVAAHAAGKGVIIVLPHIGSWEWGGAFIVSEGMPMTVVAEELEPPELFQWFTQQRERLGIRVVGLNSSASAVLLDVLGSGGVVGLLSDRDIQGGGAPVEMFGHDVTIPAGPATLALRTGAALLTACCYIGPGDDHYAVISPPIVVERQGKMREDTYRISQIIADELADLIRRAPEQWHVLEDRFGVRS